MPPTLTPLPSATWFPSATITPSLTITFTLVPSQTPIPSNTSAPTATINSFTPQPTEPPPSPFPFRLRDPQPVYTLNFANSAGCSWQGIGGQVSDMAGLAINGIRVHVYGSGVDTFSTTGSNSLYGSSGWEVPLANIVSTNVYFVELQSQGGTIISETVRVQFPGNCQQISRWSISSRRASSSPNADPTPGPSPNSGRGANNARKVSPLPRLRGEGLR
ncbi:MAG: hypothetical protein IPO91_10510 [Chloroflexi bacterium]|nr:hypothetical protein [Chloroflexota bacterium]